MKEESRNIITLKTMSFNDCTIGRLRCVNPKLGIFDCFTLELPWLDNRTNISCYQPGVYEYFLRDSPSNGRVLQLKDVPGRTFIQVHSANFTRQLAGCVAVGDQISYLNGDRTPDVANSKHTMGLLLSYAGKSGIIKTERSFLTGECNA